jgi:cation diffusion facilitator family transporter
VVILGLILVKVSELSPKFSWLRQADSVAALGVSGIVIYVSIQLGIRTIRGLLDTSPEGMEKTVREIAESVEGVQDCHQVRIRESGPSLFADVHIRLAPRTSVAKAHEKTLLIQKKVREKIPGMDVTVHVEPAKTK